jgi:hypothetical protein
MIPHILVTGLTNPWKRTLGASLLLLLGAGLATAQYTPIGKFSFVLPSLAQRVGPESSLFVFGFDRISHAADEQTIRPTSKIFEVPKRAIVDYLETRSRGLTSPSPKSPPRPLARPYRHARS